jgi:hypothetical protein
MKKLPKLNIASSLSIELIKKYQETIFFIFLFEISKLKICKSSHIIWNPNNDLLKRHIFFKRDKHTQEILYRNKSKTFIYSKYIKYLIQTTYRKKGKDVKKSTDLIRTY